MKSMMKSHSVAVMTICSLMCLAIGATAVADSQDLVGMWKGTLQAGPIHLRLVIKIDESEDGLTGTLDSVDQGANDIPISKIKVAAENVTLTVKAVGGVFQAQFDETHQKLTGTWHQGGGALPLVVERSEEGFQLNRPQVPQPPFPYSQREVVFENQSAGISLAGTLTLPAGDGPFPAVVLVSGSGPQDRDESLMGHQPFLVLADDLTRRGIAVLRFDDRGVGGSTGDFAKATPVDFKDDALAALKFLQSVPEVDSQKIGICGHSEGGLVAPLAAAESPDVAFIVIMAGPGVIGEQILYRQSELILKSMEMSESMIEQSKKLQRKTFAIVKSETDSDTVRTQVQQAIADHESQLSEADKKSIEALGDMREAEIKMIATPWFRWFLTHDPVPVLAQVRCPVLAITGEKDLQVDPDQNLPVIRQALTAAGHDNFTVKELPQLNHLFQTCQTGSVAEYGQIEETMAPVALEEIGSWIVQQVAQ